MAMETVKASTAWLQTFVALYEKAAPIVRRIANPGMLAAGELPVSPYTLVESNLTLRPILDAIRKASEPLEQDLASMRREFEIALGSSIKAAEAAVKYIELQERGVDARASLSTIISSTVLAHEYFESVSVKLGNYKSKMTAPTAESAPEPLPVEDYLQEMERVGKKNDSLDKQKKASRKDVVQSSTEAQPVIDKVAGGIEYGLDKLGDAIIFPFDQIARVATKISRIARKEKG